MYPHPTQGVSTDDVILSFDHYLWFNPKPCAVYMDGGMHFTSQKLRLDFWKKDIVVIFPPFISHKSGGLIEKSNNILK